MPALILKPGREKSLLRRHPWVFSGAIQKMEGDPASGETVEILTSKGELVARGAYSPHSQIRARVWTFEDETIDADALRRRVRASIDMRKMMAIDDTANACRLVHAESDGLPGLIVDRYADLLVLQSLSTGVEFWKEQIADILLEGTGLRHIYERSDADVRELEGLPSRTGWLRGGRSENSLQIEEKGLKFNVNYVEGHKTGFYLDQRLNRQRVRELARGRQVLDCFCYSGGFAVNALAGGAEMVTAVDSSAAALAQAREHVALNGFSTGKVNLQEGDVFQALRKFRDAGAAFDMIVLDPPKFAPSASQAEKAARAYKDINLLGFKLLRPGGLLVTFSCSGGVDADLFQKIVASAALDAGVEAQIFERLSQAPDHPVSLHFPEGTYLKGLVCRRGDLG